MAISATIELNCTQSKLYRERTKINARESDLTLYFHHPSHANSKGRILTEEHSVLFYPIELPVRNLDAVVNDIVARLQSIPFPIVNIAGNAIYRFPVEVSQQKINEQIYDVLSAVSKRKRIFQLRSGGQTGADWGGIVAGALLEIPIHALFPEGFRQRNRARKDIVRTAAQIFELIVEDAENLKPVQL
jgi:hypothetical protein